MEKSCLISVFDMKFRINRPCMHPATVMRDGKSYCTRHDPMLERRGEPTLSPDTARELIEAANTILQAFPEQLPG